MYYLSPGPLLWVTPLTAFPTPVPATAWYNTLPVYYAPPAEPTMPIMYGAPVAQAPYYYPYPTMPAPQRGEYHLGRYLCICQ